MLLSLQRLLIAACYLMQGFRLMEVPQNEWLIITGKSSYYWVFGGYSTPILGHLHLYLCWMVVVPESFIICGVESSSGDLLPTFLTNQQVASSHSVPCNTVDGCEILHHLEWLKPYNKQWDKPPIYQLVQDFATIHSISLLIPSAFFGCFSRINWNVAIFLKGKCHCPDTQIGYMDIRV